MPESIAHVSLPQLILQRQTILFSHSCKFNDWLAVIQSGVALWPGVPGVLILATAKAIYTVHANPAKYYSDEGVTKNPV
jgi:hypothetical protein